MDVLAHPSEMDCRVECMPHSWEVVLPLAQLSQDLGMRGARALERQLGVDLPRSLVFVHGRRATTPREVMRATRLGRLCTQAVLAPPVEWLLLRMGLIAHEVASCSQEAALPMTAAISHGGRCVHVTKRLALREWMSDVPRGRVLIELHADETAGQTAYRFTLQH